MNLDELRKEAAEHGYLIKQMPSLVLATWLDIKYGRDTSRAVADINGMKIAAAHMRIRRLVNLGLARELREKDCPSGGKEIVFELV